jgi:coenzyme Q-binding protein COQ10
MATIRDSIVINAPVEKVFAYASDPTFTPDYWPSMVEVRNVQDHGDGILTYDWTYKMGGIRLEGSSEVVKFVPNKLLKTISKGGIESTITWMFAPIERGTQMDTLFEYSVPLPVLGRLAEGLILKQNERESKMILANLKMIVEVAEPVAKMK